MKTDLDYMKKLINVFQHTDKAYITFSDWEKDGINITTIDEEGNKKADEMFIHHVALLVENCLISNKELKTKDLNKIGIRFSQDGGIQLSVVELRLTSAGEDFSKALNESSIFNKLKENIGTIPFDIAISCGSELIKDYAMKHFVIN